MTTPTSPQSPPKTEGLRLIPLNMTAEEIAIAKQGWMTKLTSSLRAVGRTHSEVLHLDIQTAVIALDVLDRVVPVEDGKKSAAIAAAATPPRFIDEGGTEPRPAKGPYAKPGAPGSAPPKANLPPPSGA